MLDERRGIEQQCTLASNQGGNLSKRIELVKSRNRIIRMIDFDGQSMRFPAKTAWPLQVHDLARKPINAMA